MSKPVAFLSTSVKPSFIWVGSSGATGTVNSENGPAWIELAFAAL